MRARSSRARGINARTRSPNSSAGTSEAYVHAVVGAPGTCEFVAIARFDDVLAAERNAADLSSAQGYRVHWEQLEHTMISQDDPGHLAQRRRLTPTLTPRAVTSHADEYRALVCELVDDWLSRWLHPPDGQEPLSMGDIVMETGLLIAGGAETTRTLISHGLRTFCDHPDQWELLHREPERIPGAVEEMLRWVSPLNNMFRTAVRVNAVDRRTGIAPGLPRWGLGPQ